jgi:hypothetical protein
MLVDGQTVADGQAAADAWGLVTIEKLPVSKQHGRIVLERQ